VSTRTYVDVHILHTVPPSNLNRDDAGTPKQAMYGGVRRARVSSQAWKRATRKAFTERLHLPPQQLGVRTKRIARLLADRLAERTGLDNAAAERLSVVLLKDIGVTASKTQEGETSYLLFFGNSQLDAIADLVAGNAAELAALSSDEALEAAVKDLPVREALMAGHPIDVALFGRMVADLSMLNIEAATQVAHALSTHAAEIEFDYYTAVDDAKDPRKEDAGAAMIGTVEFTSATLYRFATVGVHQLLDNLGGDAEMTVTGLAAFLEAFVYSMPTGHQNTFAHRTLPSLVSVVVREDQPVNLVSAFEAPVRADRGEGIARKSAELLAAELERASTAWGLTPLLVASQYDPGVGAPTSELAVAFGEPLSFSGIIEAVSDAVRSRVPELAVR
jgi:CRISPR system Cascade subunit CasC